MIRACLAKDRDDRWASAHDVRLQLEWIARDRAIAASQARGTGPNRRRNLLAWTAAALAARSRLLAIWASSLRALTPPAPVHVLSVLPPPGSTFAIEEAPQISPDGRRLAFVGHDTAGSRLLVSRALDAFGVAQSLADTDGASMPFWSPDSRWLGFFAQGKLKKIEVATARIQTLADAARRSRRHLEPGRCDRVRAAARLAVLIAFPHQAEGSPSRDGKSAARPVGIRPFCPMAGTSCSSALRTVSQKGRGLRRLAG